MPIIQLTRDQINMLIAAMDAMLDTGDPDESAEALLRILMRAESRPRKPSIACAVSKPIHKPL